MLNMVRRRLRVEFGCGYCADDQNRFPRHPDFQQRGSPNDPAQRSALRCLVREHAPLALTARGDSHPKRRRNSSPGLSNNSRALRHRAHFRSAGFRTALVCRLVQDQPDHDDLIDSGLPSQLLGLDQNRFQPSADLTGWPPAAHMSCRQWHSPTGCRAARLPQPRCSGWFLLEPARPC